MSASHLILLKFAYCRLQKYVPNFEFTSILFKQNYVFTFFFPYFLTWYICDESKCWIIANYNLFWNQDVFFLISIISGLSLTHIWLHEQGAFLCQNGCVSISSGPLFNHTQQILYTSIVKVWDMLIDVLPSSSSFFQGLT